MVFAQILKSSWALLIWALFLVAVILPIAAAGASPLLAYRDGVYIAAGFAGVIALVLLLLQPLLISGYLPGLAAFRGRRVHRWIGGALVAALLVHVGGLWITSPPDVIDVLLFRSPTPFSAWGVVAMWAIFASALLAALRRRFSPRTWRISHIVLAGIIVAGSIVHSLLIEGTMETASKVALCGLLLVVTVRVFAGLRLWPRHRARG